MAKSARSYQREAAQLRARGWTYRQIASHWRQRYGMNSRVAFRLAHGMTQAEAAERWNRQWPDADAPKTAKQISYWEIWPGAAGRAPSLDTFNKLAFLYRCAAGDLLDGEDHSHLDAGGAHSTDPAFPAVSAPVRLREASWSTFTRVTDSVVCELETLTDSYRRLDYREGAGRVGVDVTAHLQRMLEVSDRATTLVVQRRLWRAAGDAAQLAGWLAIDGQRYEQAYGFCRLAVSLAEKANDRVLHAYGLGVVSYIHLHAGDGRAALGVLDTAREMAGRGLPPAVVSWLSEATGEAHGYLNEHRQGLAELGRAERFFDGVTPENTPPWLGFFDSECHAARLKGRCLTRLRRPAEATRALYEALTMLPPTFVRERSGTLIDLAHAYVQLRQVEQACDVAVEADTLARRTGSERNRARLRLLLLDLMPWTGQDCVQDLYRQVLLN